MKKSIMFFLAFCLIVGNEVHSQSGLLNRVARSVTNDLLGQPDSNNEPEPSCANDQASLVFDLGGKLQIDYREFTISVLDDGRVLGTGPGQDNNYISKDGVVQGPYKSGDPKLADFEPKKEKEDDNSIENLLEKYKSYISRSGEKYLITFGGKKYGPYAEIHNFIVTKSKNKFAAMVTEKAYTAAELGLKIEEALKTAKNDQERMAIMAQFAEQMATVDPIPPMPELVTNIPDAVFDISQEGSYNGNICYDDILRVTYDKIYNMQGKNILTLANGIAGTNSELFVNSSNTKYASYKPGKLTFSDNTSLSGLFNPHLVKEEGKVNLAYMYYSPKKNSIMQWKIPF